MITRIFVIRDSKIGLFMQPMFFGSRGQAQRVVGDEINRPVNGAEPATVLQSHPEDVSLYEIGEYNSEDGRISAVDPVLVCHCKDLVIGRQ